MNSVYGGITICHKHSETHHVSVPCRLCELEYKIAELEARNSVLKSYLAWAADELEGWLEDQGTYGTTGYAEKLAEIKTVIGDTTN